MYPSNYKYSNEHEWVSVEGDLAIIGITQYAGKQLGEVVYVELPVVGDSYDKGDEFGSLESVKAVAEVYMPVSGTIVEINQALEDSPDLINDDPHGNGWLVKIQMADPSQVNGLMSADAYADFIKAESE